MSNWTLTSTGKPPKRFTTVWITRKGKVRMAYLDGGKIPQWNFPNNGKSIPYDEATAWMEIEIPEPYVVDKNIIE